MASQLSSIQDPTHVFFCAYLARDSEEEAAKVNGAMLQNFLDALSQTGAIKTVKRIILTAGLKQYGVHFGNVKQPMHESDPWIEGPDRPPNFYYDQQRILAKAAPQSSWDYVVTYPQDVIGVAKSNFMNLCTALGLYCAVSAALPGSELPFPGNRINFMAFNCWTSARTNAEFCLWAATTPNREVSNQGFNVVNGDTESWQNLWPRLAARFNCVVPDVMFPGGLEDGYGDYKPMHMALAERPPIEDHASKAMGMKGQFRQSQLYLQIDPTQWGKNPKVVEAYQTLQKQYGLDQQAWENATWGFLSFLLGRDFSCVASMSKARKAGWTGYRDTWDEFEHTFDELEKIKVLPPSHH